MNRLIACLVLCCTCSLEAMVKSSGAGPFTIPTAPSVGTAIAQSASANNFGSYVQTIASTANAIYITGVIVNLASGTNKPSYVNVQIGTGVAASEVTVGQIQIAGFQTSGVTGDVVGAIATIFPPIPVATSTRIALKTASDVASALAWNVSLQCINQSLVVDAGVDEKVNVDNINSVSTSSVTTINASQGTTQPLNFTGTGASALVKSDVTDIATAAVSASTAQLGVNVVNYNGNAVSASTNGIPDVNMVRINNGLTNGNNATLSLAGLSIVAAAGNDAVTLTGGAASGSTPAGTGLRATGGAASTTIGGNSGQAIKAIGGAGAASSNGAAAGATFTAGGTTTVSGNDGATFTGTGNSNGLTAAKAGSGQDINATLLAVTTATNLTNLPSIPANWLTASGIAASALNGKGDWLLSSSYRTSAQEATAIWADTVAGDFTTSASIGKSVMNGVALGTGLTVNALTTNNDKSGYSLSVAPPTSGAIATAVWGDTTAGDFTVSASVGKSVMNGVALGTGLTVNSLTNLPSIPSNWLTAAGIAASALNGKGDWMVSYTQPTGFLAATFPSGTIANTTNITAGTITTTTNLTNAPTAGDFTAAMKTSLNNATPTVVLSASDSPTVATGTATAGAASTITLQTALGADSLPNGQTIKITSGTGAKQTRRIIGYVDSTKVVTVDRAWTTNPSTDSVYAILATSGPKVDSSLQDTAASVQGNVTGSVASVTGAVGSVTSGVTVTTNNDKTGYSLAASQHVIVDSGTVTTLTNLPSIPNNWLTAAGIAAGALNGKGDWLTYGGYTTPPTVAQIATGVWQDTTAGDFTLALSIGKSVLNGVTLGTGLTINAYTGNTPQTGDAYARIGAAGAGLTAIGDLRMADLDTTVSSRMATYTQPTGFLSATFPSGTIANTTNITAGTITTTTNLTNLPSIPANWITAAGITAAALNGKGDWNIGKTGYSLTVTPPTAAQIATQIWQDTTATPDFTTAGSIGLLLTTDINATISSRSTYAGADTAGTTTLLTRIPSDIWDEVIASHLTPGSTGVSLNAAGSAGDPWATALPGAYGLGTAGYLLGHQSNLTKGTIY
jgi:hypothetical protein